MSNRIEIGKRSKIDISLRGEAGNQGDRAGHNTANEKFVEKGRVQVWRIDFNITLLQKNMKLRWHDKLHKVN